jgi:hypothetical protein
MQEPWYFEELKADPKFKSGDRAWFDRAIKGLGLAESEISPGPGRDERDHAKRVIKDFINWLKMLAEKDEAGPRQWFSADNIARSEVARTRLLPEVEQVRREVFGRATVPYQGLAAASAALTKELQQDEERFKTSLGDPEAWGATVRDLEARIAGLIRQRNLLHPVRWFPEQDEMTIDVFMAFKKKKRGKPPGAMYPWRTYPGTRFRRLVEGTRELAALSNFSERGLLYFVLAGIPPLLETARIEIRGPVNSRDLLAWYKRLPAFVKRPRKLRPRSVDTYNFIRDFGGPPKIGKMEFWQMATAKWNRVHRDRRFASPDALRKAYSRTAAKMLATG